MPFLKKYNACPRWKEKEETTYKSGQRNTVYFLNGDKHIGEWKKNLKDGKGTQLTRSNYLYEGDFSHEVRHGHGNLSKLQPDGTFRLVYNGEWSNGKRHGYGIQWGKDGSWYDGYWRDGKRSGDGRMWLPDGSFYQGQWQDDKFDGLGLFLLSNGNRYEGTFSHGLRHGKGKFFHLESNQLQEGVWDEGVCICSTVVGSTTSNNPHRLPPIGLYDVEKVEAEGKEHALAQLQSKRSSQAGSFSTHSTESTSYRIGFKSQTTLSGASRGSRTDSIPWEFGE